MPCCAVQALRNPGMRDRHWDLLTEQLGFKLHPEKTFTLTKVLLGSMGRVLLGFMARVLLGSMGRGEGVELSDLNEYNIYLDLDANDQYHMNNIYLDLDVNDLDLDLDLDDVMVCVVSGTQVYRYIGTQVHRYTPACLLPAGRPATCLPACRPAYSPPCLPAACLSSASPPPHPPATLPSLTSARPAPCASPAAHPAPCTLPVQAAEMKLLEHLEVIGKVADVAGKEYSIEQVGG